MDIHRCKFVSLWGSCYVVHQIFTTLVFRHWNKTLAINKRVMYERARYHKRVYAKGFMYLSLVITCTYVLHTTFGTQMLKNPFKLSKLRTRLPGVGDWIKFFHFHKQKFTYTWWLTLPPKSHFPHKWQKKRERL
jgi:hypothetical protein